jgi:hypothetical protein
VLFHEAISTEALGLLKFIQARSEFVHTRLVGGTALALQIGHRLSVDLDVFGTWNPDIQIQRILSEWGRTRQENAAENIQTFTVTDINVDFVQYPYLWLEPPVTAEGVFLASVRDIAPMKLSAICNRGSRKDFIDLAFILETETLTALLEAYDRKYPDGSRFMVLKSLSYFADAEPEPMPTMLRSLPWEEAKARIRQALLGVA